MSFATELRQKASRLWHIQRVKALARAHTTPGPNALITVTEVECDDPACPGPATHITILGIDLVRRSLLIHRPVADVTAADMRLQARSGRHHRDSERAGDAHAGFSAE